jgi:hypothetical protein
MVPVPSKVTDSSAEGEVGLISRMGIGMQPDNESAKAPAATALPSRLLQRLQVERVEVSDLTMVVP